MKYVLILFSICWPNQEVLYSKNLRSFWSLWFYSCWRKIVSSQEQSTTTLDYTSAQTLSYITIILTYGKTLSMAKSYAIKSQRKVKRLLNSIQLNSMANCRLIYIDFVCMWNSLSFSSSSQHQYFEQTENGTESFGRYRCEICYSLIGIPCDMLCKNFELKFIFIEYLDSIIKS